MLNILERIVRECQLHATGPHDKTGNMLTIQLWAQKALEQIKPDVEEFEYWTQARGYILNFDKVDCFPPVYEHPDTQYAWEIWVASFDAVMQGDRS